MSAVYSAFSTLPLAERWFVRGRGYTAPLGRVAAEVPAGVRVLDVGCGHGLLVAHLAAPEAGRTVVGLDIDARKVAWAQASVGRLPNVSVVCQPLEAFAIEHAGAFDAVTLADVLYLLPPQALPAFVASLRRCLKPGGQLVLKEAIDDGSWKRWKCLAQEQLMVRLLRRTAQSGGLALPTCDEVAGLLRRPEWELEKTVDLSSGYTTPHWLFVAKAL